MSGLNMRKKPEDQEKKEKKKFRLSSLIYHNSFVLACSFIITLVGWFVTAAGSDVNRTNTVYDVPIQVSLSAEAEAEGLRVFNMSYSSVDIDVSGSSIITSKLTAEDFEVTAALNPTSTKLTGNTTQKVAAQGRVAESSVLSAGTGFYPGTPVLSEEKVNISGPESSVNKISRVAVASHVENPLRENTDLTCPLRLYDQDNQEITDTAGLYLSMDIDAVQVTIPVMPKKTVPLVASYAHRPTGTTSRS